MHLNEILINSKSNMRSSLIHIYYSDKFCLFTFLLSSISVCTQYSVRVRKIRGSCSEQSWSWFDSWPFVQFWRTVNEKNLSTKVKMWKYIFEIAIEGPQLGLKVSKRVQWHIFQFDFTRRTIETETFHMLILYFHSGIWIGN